MKKCKNCGTLQNDSRTTCLECGKLLGKPLSAAEEEEANEAIGDRLDDLSDRAEDFYVPVRDKIMGAVSAVGLVADVVMLIILSRLGNPISGYMPSKSNEVTLYAFISLFCLIAALPLLLLPELMWKLETMKYRMFYNWDTTPSETALLFRKAIAYITFAVGTLCVLYAYFLFFIN